MQYITKNLYGLNVIARAFYGKHYKSIRIGNWEKVF